MKKKHLLIAGLLLTLGSPRTFAQLTKEKGFSNVKGANLLNAGVGIGGYGLEGTGGLPLTASFEHGFGKNITAGIDGGFVQRKYAEDFKYKYILVGVRGSYHFNEVLKINNPKLDVYGGIGLLYRHYGFKYKAISDDPEIPSFDYSESAGTVDVQIHGGARYLFGKTVGTYVELSYGISLLQAGISFKL